MGDAGSLKEVVSLLSVPDLPMFNILKYLQDQDLLKMRISCSTLYRRIANYINNESPKVAMTIYFTDSIFNQIPAINISTLSKDYGLFAIPFKSIIVGRPIFTDRHRQLRVRFCPETLLTVQQLIRGHKIDVSIDCTSVLLKSTLTHLFANEPVQRLEVPLERLHILKSVIMSFLKKKPDTIVRITTRHAWTRTNNETLLPDLSSSVRQFELECRQTLVGANRKRLFSALEDMLPQGCQKFTFMPHPETEPGEILQLFKEILDSRLEVSLALGIRGSTVYIVPMLLLVPDDYTIETGYGRGAYAVRLRHNSIRL